MNFLSLPSVLQGLRLDLSQNAQEWRKLWVRQYDSLNRSISGTATVPISDVTRMQYIGLLRSKATWLRLVQYNTVVKLGSY